jgi:hypothetical protein
LATIRERQNIIEQTGKHAPLLIFAEGGTTNGSGLISFKKGAFFAEKTIRPIFLKYSWYQFSPSFDVLELLPLVIMMLSFPFACFRCEVNVMPDFEPNDYLFETHKEHGEERWEVYAWALREVMKKTGGFEDCVNPIRQKIQYEAYMQKKEGVEKPNFASSLLAQNDKS